MLFRPQHGKYKYSTYSFTYITTQVHNIYMKTLQEQAGEEVLLKTLATTPLHHIA